MEANFWLQRWANQEIGFHLSEANVLFTRHFHALSLSQGQRLFLPLCGKTRDIHWLLSQGYQVAGAELSELAVKQLFEELDIQADVTQHGDLLKYSGPDLDIFVGDIFALTAEYLGGVDAVYDRAALVALPEPMRERYTEHLVKVTHNAPQLLISYAYDQSKMPGPPFSVTAQEVKQRYQHCYVIETLESVDVEGGLKGQCEATETVWLLHK